MSNQEIIARLQSVCNALDSITIAGVRNASNLAGSFVILEEIIQAIAMQEEDENTSKDE
jgi:hypothetical protein